MSLQFFKQNISLLLIVSLLVLFVPYREARAANYTYDATNSRFVAADAKSTYSGARDATTADASYSMANAVNYIVSNGFLSSNYYVRRADLQFDTSAAGTVSAAKLWLYIPSTGAFDNDSYTVELVDNTNNVNLSSPLATEDFNDFTGTSIGSKDLTLLSNIGGWVSIDITDLNAIDNAGTTRIGLRMSGDINNSSPSAYNALRIDTTSGREPYLELTETGGGGDTITLTDITSGKIIQRNASNEGSLTVSGTYSGSPTAIQARVVNHGTDTEVKTWTTIDAAPTGGTFSGTLTGIPDGGWYNVDVRYSNDTGVTDGGTNQWGVGILVGVIGQSLGEQWFTVGSSLTANDITRKYNQSGWQTNTGDGAIAFANSLATQYSVPVGLFDYGVDGTCLLGGLHVTDYWLNTANNAIYDVFRDGVAAQGDYLEYVVYIQGECDAAYGGTEANYEAGLSTLLSRIRTDIQHYGNGVPFLISLLGRWTGGGQDAGTQGIRSAQEDFANSTSTVYIGATIQDLPLADTVHLTNLGYITQGQRMAQTVKFILGDETYYEGPKVNTFAKVDSTKVNFYLTHDGGSSFTPTSSISAFEIFDDGSAETITSAVQVDGSTIQATVSGSLDGTVTARYLYGNTTDVDGLVFDDTAMTLPMRTNTSITEVSLPTVSTYNQRLRNVTIKNVKFR